MDSAAFSDGKVTPDEVEEHAADAAHHGVAVPLSSGDLLLTQGTAEASNTVQVISREGDVLAQTTDCPGVHGEATAQPTDQGDVVSLGCENGPVIYRDGAFSKVPVEEQYQRSGNQFGHHGSPIVLADYKTDPDAEQERPTRIGLIDTHTGSMSTVDLGSPYWFRSLARGADGEALVLTYDGELNILDEETGKILHEVPVTQAWEEPAEWQSPGPAVKVGTDGFAYVSEPATKKLHVIDVAAGTLVDSLDLPETPVELAVLTGEAEAPDHAHENDHADGDHAEDEEQDK
jgi:outer membrane protein assembly factor BamB